MQLHSFLTCAVIGLLMTCGCVGLSGTGGSVAISSTPPGAVVYFDGTREGVTPIVLSNVPPGVHHVTIQRDENSRFETDVTVVAGSTAVADWTPEQVMETRTTAVTFPVFSLESMKGYRGGGEYITSLSYDISLAPGAKPVNISGVNIALTTGNETIYPYWQVADKKHANMDDLLEAGETFLITMRTPRLGPGETFTLMIIPKTGEPYITSHTLPAKIGLDVQF